tara:strand:- start:1544 stop:2629 length:1086 start_codon:yes stop_codon:yes gene_type:complete
MKILLPYSTHFEVVKDQDSSGTVITGGIEKFCKDLEDNIDGIIPLCITKDDKDNRNTKRKIRDAIAMHNPDMILFNNPWWGNMMRTFGVPLISIMHEPLVRDIRMVELGTILRDLNDYGAHIWFVSSRQLDFHRDMSKRIKNVDFGEIKGFINPSYLPYDMPISSETTYDVSTVGRCDNEKAPFLIHDKLKNTDLNSLVMTNDGVYKSDTVNDYVASNQHWSEPQYTMRGLPHSDVMKMISKSKVFCSTWPKESWGITTMEALGCGVPVILFTDDSDAHASEAIAAHRTHYIKVNRKCSRAEFETTVREFANVMKDRRDEIAEMTRRKHSLANWKLGIDKMLQMRYNDKNKTYSDLTEFFT